jgi:hypothetical protein
MKRVLAALALVPLLAVPARATTACTAFPADNYWHAKVSALPVSGRSAQWLSHMSPTRTLHPDFGDSYGIPITHVAGSHAKVGVTFDFASESDRVGYPLGSDTRLEGGSDHHAVVVDNATCTLYETWDTRRSGTRWYAGSGAHWNLTSNALRPDGWTSADAAGLPILPGLLRYDEVAAGHVDHAIRFTTDVTDRHHLWPARHDAGSVSDVTYPRMGARFRLKASFAISAYRPDTRAVLQAMKTYGLVLADNGSPWYFQGEQSTRWPSALLDQLKTIPARAFEAVDTSRLMISPSSAQSR